MTEPLKISIIITQDLPACRKTLAGGNHFSAIPGSSSESRARDLRISKLDPRGVQRLAGEAIKIRREAKGRECGRKRRLAKAIQTSHDLPRTCPLQGPAFIGGNINPVANDADTAL